MDKLELLYDHFKDQRQLLQNLYKERNHSFIILSIAWLLVFAFRLNADGSRQAIIDFLSTNIPFDIHVFRMLTWLVFGYALLRYANVFGQIGHCSVWIVKLGKSIDKIIDGKEAVEPVTPEDLSLKHVLKLGRLLNQVYTLAFPFAIFLYLTIIPLKEQIISIGNNGWIFSNTILIETLVTLLIISISIIVIFHIIGYFIKEHWFPIVLLVFVYPVILRKISWNQIIVLFTLILIIVIFYAIKLWLSKKKNISPIAPTQKQESRPSPETPKRLSRIRKVKRPMRKPRKS